MVKVRVDLIVGDKRTIEYAVWSEWMNKVAVLIDRHVRLWEDDDPFAYNETASAALLAAAGSLAGHVALAECVTEKLAAGNKDGTKIEKRKRHGRADLWLHTKQKHWAFEFKQRMNVGVSRSGGRLLSHLSAARGCAQQVIDGPDGAPVAGLIVSLYFIEADDVARRAAEEVEAFAQDQVAYCWRLWSQKGRPTYFIFDPVR